MLKVSKVILYDEPSVPDIDMDGLARFVKRYACPVVERRMSIMSYGGPDAAALVASTRTSRHDVPFSKQGLPAMSISNAGADRLGIQCHDGFELQKTFGGMIPKDEMILDIFHVIFTNLSVCTYDDIDYRYHSRALIGSNPSIISTTGMVEAPARSKEYHLDVIMGSRLGEDMDAIEQRHARSFLGYHDNRIPSVARGYFLQAWMYYVTGEPFCDSRDCMLFNAHWQEELLHAHVDVGRLCRRHQDILESMNNLN